MRMLILSVALALLASSAVAETKVTLDGKNTKIQFVGTKKGGKHEGGFHKLSGTATAGSDPTTLKISVEIDTTSLYSDNKKLTGHLQNQDFFDVKKYPTAKFVTTKVEKAKEGYTITGDLTLLGKTKAVSFPATVEVKDGKLSLKSSKFTINRSEWGMTYGKGMVNDEVTLTVSIDAK
jgi:polyisoprenoid-binding protein YceI